MLTNWIQISKAFIVSHASRFLTWLKSQVHNPLRPGEKDELDSRVLALVFLFLIVWAAFGPRLVK